MRNLVRGMAGVALALTAALAAPAAALAVDTQPMYRLYNPNGGEHFYTANAGERDILIGLGWHDEGTGWTAPTTSKTPVYRLYNPNGGDHHYTMSAGERDLLVEVGWNNEGTGWYSDDNKGTPLYRQYNPNAKTGAHNFTTSTGERDMLIKAGWHDEGIGWYGVANKKNNTSEDDLEPESGRTDPQSGNLVGSIYTASESSQPITGANVSIYSGDILKCAMNSDGNGQFQADLPAGDYRVVVTKEGFVPFVAYANVPDSGTEYLEAFLMVVAGDESSRGVAEGRISDAVTTASIEGVSLTVREGWNNQTEGDVVTTTSTDSNGLYSVTLPYGNYTLIAAKDGYITNFINIIVQEGTTGSQDGMLSPIGASGDYRVVLTWRKDPRDLDSHVEGKLSNGNPFHVFYRYKSQYDGDVEVCNLDVDDTDSYGPETVTLKLTSDSPYYYYVYRYAGEGTVAASGAQIKLYQGERLLRTINVPTNLGNGDYWNVFAIVGDNIVVRNTITSAKEVNYA